MGRLRPARSLQARDGFPLAVGIALWEIYNLAALRHSLGAPRRTWRRWWRAITITSAPGRGCSAPYTPVHTPRCSTQTVE
ncbi:MAG TPA: hypothetical protein VF789_10745 [Thermoanaerobaculia bacterium]